MNRGATRWGLNQSILPVNGENRSGLIHVIEMLTGMCTYKT